MFDSYPVVREHLARDTPYLAWHENNIFSGKYSKGVVTIGAFKAEVWSEKDNCWTVRRLNNTPRMVKRALRDLSTAEIEIFFGNMPEEERRVWRETFPEATEKER